MIALANTPAMGPVVSISGSSPDSASVKAMMRQMREAGTTPIFLGNHAKRDAAADLQKIDALIVLGNNADIDPGKYGEARHTTTKSENDTPEGRARAAYEEALLQGAADMKMPILGVCGGMQRINIMAGGSLHQHIPDLVGHNEHSQQDYKIEGYVPVQPVLLAKETLLSQIAQGISTVFTPGHGVSAPSLVLENSMHHQAVNVVGEGLRPSAFSDDKVKLPDGRESLLIEAIEADPNGKYKDQTLLGVQWHPEFGASPLGAKIAQFMSGAAQAYALENNREHSMQEVARENMLSALAANVPIPRPGSMTEMVLRRRMESANQGLAL
jgi:gamma-glutamyl-gamma-aminobutyrate hydrolase PuuD